MSIQVKEARTAPASLELRASKGGKGPGTLVGYTAVFNKFSEDLGGFREKIAPGAFRACLKQDVRALVNHDSNFLLGRSTAGTLRMAEDPIGLRVEIDLPDTSIGRDTAESVRRGDLTGMSFSFVADRDSWDHKASPAERTLLSIRDLYDVGPVAYPAYTDTSTAMRSGAIVIATHVAARARQAAAERAAAVSRADWSAADYLRHLEGLERMPPAPTSFYGYRGELPAARRSRPWLEGDRAPEMPPADYDQAERDRRVALVCRGMGLDPAPFGVTGDPDAPSPEDDDRKRQTISKMFGLSI